MELPCDYGLGAVKPFAIYWSDWDLALSWLAPENASPTASVGRPTTNMATVVAHGHCRRWRESGRIREARNDVVSTSAYKEARRPDVIY
jgi:hypothetical protein